MFTNRFSRIDVTANPLRIIPKLNKDTRLFITMFESSVLIWFAALNATHNIKNIPAPYIAFAISPLFSTDKISKIIEEIIDLNSPEISIVLISEILEKKSKVRNLFEKNKNTICVAFYEDNNLTLNKIAFDFFKQKKISISQQNINLIVERSSGNRINLTNELKKIENFSINKKIVSTKDLIKLTNLAENYDYTNLVNCSLAKNKKKTMNILNENNLSNEDCIIILRIFLNKLKRLLKIFSNSLLLSLALIILTVQVHILTPASYWFLRLALSKQPL